MKRLTTNCPDNNLDAALNLFYIKDFETWVRGGGDGPDYPDIRLYDFIRKAAKILLPDLDFPMDDDGVDYAMGELLLDGPDEPTGLLALLYTAAWSYAELRGRLMQYEDTGLEPAMCANYKTFEDEAISKGVPFKRIVELMEADKAGRLVVLPVRPVLTQSNTTRPRQDAPTAHAPPGPRRRRTGPQYTATAQALLPMRASRPQSLHCAQCIQPLALLAFSAASRVRNTVLPISACSKDI